MAKLSFGTEDLTFKASMIQEEPTLRGYVDTTSISEHNKAYATRPVIEVSTIDVLYMSDVTYNKLVDAFFYKGNLFTLTSETGKTYDNIRIDKDLKSLTKKFDSSTRKYYYSGNISVKVR